MLKNKKIFAWVALVSLILAAVLIIIFTTNRNDHLRENPQTELAARQALETITAIHPADVNSASFLDSLAQERQRDYIAQIWVFDTQGNMVYPDDLPYSGQTAAERSTRQVNQMLAALPADEISPEQQMLIMVSSAIQAEGEHDDVFNYKVASIKNSTGEITGHVGIAYEINPWIGEKPAFGEMFSLLGFIACFGIYWLSIALWVYLDAKEHGERAFIWLIYTLIGNLAALIAYLLVRYPRKELN